MEKFTDEVMALPSEAKRILADRLAENLSNDTETAFHKNWATEAIRRRDEVRSGQVKTPWMKLWRRFVGQSPGEN